MIRKGSGDGRGKAGGKGPGGGAVHAPGATGGPAGRDDGDQQPCRERRVPRAPAGPGSASYITRPKHSGSSYLENVSRPWSPGCLNSGVVAYFSRRGRMYLLLYLVLRVENPAQQIDVVADDPGAPPSPSAAPRADSGANPNSPRNTVCTMNMSRTPAMGSGCAVNSGSLSHVQAKRLFVAPWGDAAPAGSGEHVRPRYGRTLPRRFRRSPAATGECPSTLPRPRPARAGARTADPYVHTSVSGRAHPPWVLSGQGTSRGPDRQWTGS